ncbi:MAG: ribosome small subunit-dependent GTPase A [Clostridia bacterium]|nr:ribosome small subunit-dependent GTPase A [Clostridia bacterium]
MRDGLILKKQANLFTVEFENGETKTCIARKNLKKEGIFVGDNVSLDEDNAICKIKERRNLLIRPPVANIDKMFIVVAPIPRADLYTVDKLLIFCTLNSIQPILCVNKVDLDEKFCKEIEKTYKGIVKTLVFSSFDDSVEKVKKHIKGICVLAGQSAVGKSSIINALTKSQIAEVDTFSKKIERGKQTTRVVQLYKFGKDKFLADTAGFSKLDEGLLELDERETKQYFVDFLPYAAECKYSSCMHISDKDCGVCKAVKAGKIAKSRHENYKKLVEMQKILKKY